MCLSATCRPPYLSFPLLPVISWQHSFEGTHTHAHRHTASLKVVLELTTQSMMKESSSFFSTVFLLCFCALKNSPILLLLPLPTLIPIFLFLNGYLVLMVCMGSHEHAHRNTYDIGSTQETSAIFPLLLLCVSISVMCHKVVWAENLQGPLLQMKYHTANQSHLFCLPVVEVVLMCVWLE